METALETPVIFKGDVPPAVQRQIVDFSNFHLRDVNFAHSTGRRLALTEAAVYKRPEDKKLQSRVVYTITVDDGACAFSRFPFRFRAGRRYRCRPRGASASQKSSAICSRARRFRVSILD